MTKGELNLVCMHCFDKLQKAVDDFNESLDVISDFQGETYDDEEAMRRLIFLAERKASDLNVYATCMRDEMGWNK